MEFFNNVGGDPAWPSIFELVAQEQLRDLLQPALRYVLSVYAQRYPRYLLRVVNRHEEFYALIMFFVERHYLRRHGASFSENFYGLKRRRHPIYELERSRAVAGSGPLNEESLRPQDIRWSLLFLVGVPYLRAKAQDYFEALGGGLAESLFEDRGSRSQMRAMEEESAAGRLRRFFKRSYPWLNAGFELWLLAYNAGYLFDRTAFYRPWLKWAGIDIRRLTAEDYRLANTLSPRNGGQTPKKGMLRTMRYLLLRSPRLLLDSLKYALPLAILFVKFLEWWYSPSSPARALSSTPLGPSVPPPRPLAPHPDGIGFDRDSYGQCPICKGAIENATALESGCGICGGCSFEVCEGFPTTE